MNESRDLFGAPDVRLVPIEYQERPFSHLLRVRVDRGAPPSRHIFVKVFKAAPLASERGRMRLRVAQDFETSLRIYNAMSHLEELGAVRPIVCYPEHLASVTEQTAGDNLLDHLRRHAAWFPRPDTLDRLEETMGRVGRWIKAFQAIEDPRGQISIDGLRTYVDLRLERLVSHAALAPDARQRVLAHIERLGGEVSASDLCEVPVHADLAPANVLISDRRVVVLDFAMANRGSLFHDVSRLFLQLDLLGVKPQFRSAVISRLQRALLRGFDEMLSPGRPLFRLLLLLHRVNHLGTVSLGRERFPANLYNRRVRRSHLRWIDAELGSASGASR